MVDIVFSLSACLFIVAIPVLVLKLLGKIAIHWKWLLLSLMLFFSYIAAIVTGIPLEPFFGPLDWNWGGKLLAILLWMAVLFATLKLKPGFTAADAGFTLRQKSGSVAPTLAVIAITLTFHLVLTYALGGSTYTTEELWFQALIPGLDEEPVFRGLLLYFLAMGLVSSRVNILGAHFNVAGLVLVFLFGLGHGLTFSEGSWQFSTLFFFISGFYGLVFYGFGSAQAVWFFPYWLIMRSIFSANWFLRIKILSIFNSFIGSK